MARFCRWLDRLSQTKRFLIFLSVVSVFILIANDGISVSRSRISIDLEVVGLSAMLFVLAAVIHHLYFHKPPPSLRVIKGGKHEKRT
ncbi:MAG: hypothetical protein WCT10_03755 [Patescibacteria group bacterium]